MFRKLLAPFARFFEAHAAAHYRLERYSLGLTLGIIAAAMVGGAVEIAPLFTIDETVEAAPDMRVYTPLEQAGRDIYVREGCYACHSQMIRTLRDEVDRYGPYSLAVELKYDHPMLWGSKRTGPDLARIGEKYSDAWQVAHLVDPRALVPESVMPQYAFLLGRDARGGKPAGAAAGAAGGRRPLQRRDDRERRPRRASARRARTPKPPAGVVERYGEATHVRAFDGRLGRVTEMDALVAYLQILGKLTDLPEETQPTAEY